MSPADSQRLVLKLKDGETKIVELSEREQEKLRQIVDASDFSDSKVVNGLIQIVVLQYRHALRKFQQGKAYAPMSCHACFQANFREFDKNSEQFIEMLDAGIRERYGDKALYETRSSSGGNLIALSGENRERFDALLNYVMSSLQISQEEALNAVLERMYYPIRSESLSQEVETFERDPDAYVSGLYGASEKTH